MALVVVCPPCGQAIRAETEEDLVKQVTQHAKDAHNHAVTREEILAMVKRD